MILELVGRPPGHPVRVREVADNNSISLTEFTTPVGFFYVEHRIPRFNHWNTTEPGTYWYDGSKFTSRLGNYYPDYDGDDTDGDGIGDTPYRVGPNNVDYSPLLQPPSAYSFTRPNDTRTTQPSHPATTTTGSAATTSGSTAPVTTPTTAGTPGTAGETSATGQREGGFGVIAGIVAVLILLSIIRRR